MNWVSSSLKKFKKTKNIYIVNESMVGKTEVGRLNIVFRLIRLKQDEYEKEANFLWKVDLWFYPLQNSVYSFFQFVILMELNSLFSFICIHWNSIKKFAK